VALERPSTGHLVAPGAAPAAKSGLARTELHLSQRLARFGRWNAWLAAMPPNFRTQRWGAPRAPGGKGQIRSPPRLAPLQRPRALGPARGCLGNRPPQKTDSAEGGSAPQRVHQSLTIVVIVMSMQFGSARLVLFVLHHFVVDESRPRRNLCHGHVVDICFPLV
jgi:hypothetical protein